MTRRQFRECDVCGDEIAEENRYKAMLVKRSLLGRFRVGIQQYISGCRGPSGWTSSRFDVCTYCRERIVREVKKRADDS